MSRAPLRARIADATRAAHERMHGHPGFAAAAAGWIDHVAYADLLARLYGFYAPLEAGFATAPPDMAQAIALPERRRAPALAADLAALGLPTLEGLAHAPPPAWREEAAWLGALYVTEGSTLGGAHIARALERASYAAGQRHYFEAYGERRGALWRLLLARLERFADDASASDAAEAAACAQFDAFAEWMKDWEGASAATCST